MRKLFTLSLAALAILAFAVNPILAGDEATTTKPAADKATCAGKEASATTTSAKAGCPMMKSADAKTGAAQCTAHGTSAAMTPEECAKLCGKDGGKCEMVNMSIKGMTCGGCENTVTTSLEKVPGVLKVVSVSYKEGTALVCIDPTKCKGEALTTAVTNSGYDAKVVPAVATTTTAGTMEHGKACSAESKAACEAAAKKGVAPSCASKKGEAEKTSDKPTKGEG
jgi:copper chaperone